MRNKQKIVIFFGKNRNCADPFAGFGAKRAVYHQLFQAGRLRNFDMYLASGRESHLGKLVFQDPWLYNGSFFEKQPGIISADAIYDRSGGLKFPSSENSDKTLNGIAFKQLCYNKNLTYSLLSEFMPKSYYIGNALELQATLKNFNAHELAVLKPVAGFGGKDIFIDFPKNLALLHLTDQTEYTLQQFIDTQKGIPGIISGYHDLRIIIVEGEVVLCHVRAPKEGSLLANVAQGGSIREIDLALIPENINRVISMVRSVIDIQFNKPIYSIDFGVANNKPYVFELNDQIGFPSADMKNAPIFIEKVLDSLERLAKL